MTGREIARLGDIDVAFTASGDGPAVVLVHGLAEDSGSWAVQQQALHGWRRYAYDLRGHGATSLGAADGSLEQLSGDLLAFLREVSGPAVCVGFSLGGTVVLAAAAAEPRLVTGAVVLGTSTVVGRAAARFYAERIELIRAGGSLAAELRADTAAALHRAASEVEAVTARRVAAVGNGDGYCNGAAAMAALHSRPLTAQAASIRVPVRVIGAEHDTFCPRKAADILLDAVGHAGYDEIPGAGHLMNVDDPDAVTTTVQAALEGMN